jgi:hypothetical protein
MSRTVEFPPNGKRVQVSPRDAAQVWRSYARDQLTALGILTIPAQYAVATCQHESDFTLNEVDTEPSGYVSKGILQLSDEECIEVGMPFADLMTLDGSMDVMAILANRRVAKLCRAAVGAGIDSMSNALRGDLWAYLAFAHNEGTGEAIRSIVKYGLNWVSFVERNQAELPAMCLYGSDCITGGPRWVEVGDT